MITTAADLADDPTTSEPQVAIETPLGRPLGVTVDPAGVLYVAETQTGLVRRVDPDDTISSVAPVYEHLNDDEPYNLAAMAYGTDGFLYVATGHAVKRVCPDGAMVTVAGGGASQERPEDVPSATTATLLPTALAAGPDGSLYIVDAAHRQVYTLDRDGGLTRVAKDERLVGSAGIAVDGDGNVYVTDRFGDVIRTIAPDGTVSVFAGNPEASYSSDDIGDGGPATEAAVISPQGVAVDRDGSVYVSTVHGIRRVDSDGTITTVVESPRQEDGSITRYEPAAMLAFDAHGNLYFSETDRNRVRVVVRPGEIADGLTRVALIAGGGAAALLSAGAVAVRHRRRRAEPASPADGPTEQRTPAESAVHDHTR